MLKSLLARLVPLSLLSLPLVACTGGERASSGQCPAGEICSDATPKGLHFIGNALADIPLSTAFGPQATAIGGTQEIALEYDRGDGVLVALNLPYAADDDGGLGVTVDHTSGSVVTVKGAGSRKNYLRIVDPATDELYDRYELEGAALDTIRLTGTDFERVPTDRTEIVWAANGEQTIGIALAGQVQVGNANTTQRLVDTSMELSMPSATRVAWDQLRLASPLVGTSQLSITAGDKPATQVPVEFVAGADSMMVIDDGSPSVMTNSSTTVCFAAMNGSRYVYGLVWQFNVDGVASTHGKDALSRNCISVSAGTRTSGTIAVAAAAGGAQANVTVTIGAAARTTADHAAPTRAASLRTTTTAGDRASLVE